MRRSTSSAGFTLIELMVVIVIMLLTIGGGIAAYQSLADRQNILNTAKEIQGMLRSAQKKARVGDRPAGCDHLDNYSVVVNASNLQYATLQGNCNSGSFVVMTYTLPNNVFVQSSMNMQFLVLSGGVNNAGPVAIAFPSAGNPTWTYDFIVDPGGSITEGSLTKH